MTCPFCVGENTKTLLTGTHFDADARTNVDETHLYCRDCGRFFIVKDWGIISPEQAKAYESARPMRLN